MTPLPIIQTDHHRIEVFLLVDSRILGRAWRRTSTDAGGGSMYRLVDRLISDLPIHVTLSAWYDEARRADRVWEPPTAANSRDHRMFERG
jgi:hypothetical protein